MAFFLLLFTARVEREILGKGGEGLFKEVGPAASVMIPLDLTRIELTHLLSFVQTGAFAPTFCSAPIV